MAGIQTISGKWQKTKVLLRSKDMKNYIPETKLLDLNNLKNMLETYKMVYIKPNNGTGGFGVMRVAMKKPEGSKACFECRGGFRSQTFTTYRGLYRALVKRAGKRSFIVQKGVHLLKYHGRPFDIRIMVQQNKAGEWVPTGQVGRVAHPKKIVTNFHNGGRPLPLHVLLTAYMGKKKTAATIGELNDVSLKAAKSLQVRYKRIKEIGVDIGLDNKLNPWIIEVNTRPDRYIFNQLKDKSMYRRICRYAVGYGRLPAKRAAAPVKKARRR
ncbi:MAG: endospore coat-associated protein [Paenibacillaceae bacterium]|jgi:glutathione synthase/RimK-type ligase-like ATP-grasp enzyme|nr:endospore coat-associated protein [Paenibacillaceae bacterium]